MRLLEIDKQVLKDVEGKDLICDTEKAHSSAVLALTYITFLLYRSSIVFPLFSDQYFEGYPSCF